jgi:hypothetical protein
LTPECAFVEGKESTVDLPCLSFHFFRLLLFVRQNFEDLQNGSIEWLRDVRAVRAQRNEHNTVRPAELCNSRSHVRRVHIDHKDDLAFISKLLTKLIDLHNRHRIHQINKQYFSNDSFRCCSESIIISFEELLSFQSCLFERFILSNEALICRIAKCEIAMRRLS